MRIPILLLICWLTTSAFVGSGTAKLTCRSTTGRTTFTAYLQDIVGIFEGGALTIDGTVLEFPEAGDCDTGDVVWDPQNGVFTISFLHSTPDGPVWFRFWAIPHTFKIISSERGSVTGAIYEFEGVIEAKEPRPDKALITPEIRMICRLDYRI